MEDYITTRQAIEITGKSESTIRRIIRNLTTSEKSQYTVMKGRSLMLDREFILDKIGAEPGKVSIRTFDAQTTFDTQRDTIKHLRWLSEKQSDTISDKDETIKELMAKLLQVQNDLKLLEMQAQSLKNKKEAGSGLNYIELFAVLVLILALAYLVVQIV
jgi:hypothetical protein